MTSNSMKRPSSARRHINLESFNQFVSGARLAKIQSLLKGNNPDANSPESIICITGIDSRYNEGNQQLVNYLLFGFFSTRKQELERSGFPDEAIDDIILVINSNSIDIYCNIINYHYLLPYTCHWLNVRYHCLTDQQAEVEEAEEEFKMFSFVTMVKNKNPIAIPYFPTGHVDKFDKMALEKWPLIQAFALDEIGGGGFFTMKHEVEDISSKVHEIYSHIDTVSLETILTQNLPLLRRQWDNMETRINLEISCQVDKLTENIAAEALMSYYKHGHMIDSKSTDSRYKYPFVLFGCHSNETDIKKCRNGLTENNKSLLTSGINNGSPKLMVCQAVSPNSPVVCSRTYFFTSILDPFSEGIQATRKENDDWIISEIYQAVIEGVITGIKLYSKTLNLKKASNKVLYIIEEKIRELGHPVLQDYFNQGSKIVFEIDGIDNIGRSYKLDDGVYSPLMKVASLSLLDVPSVEHAGKSHGSIVFSETFIDSSFTIKDESDRCSDYVVVTSDIPRICLWTINNKEITLCQELPDQMSQLTKYGEKLVSRETIQYTTSSPDYSQIFTGEVYIYENCIVIYHKEYGCILLTHADIKNIQLYDRDSNNCAWLLILCLDKSSSSKIPAHLITDRNELIFILTPKSKLRKLFYSKVLPTWKTESSFPCVERTETLPKYLTPLSESLEIKFNARSDTAITPLEKTAPHIPHLKRFLDHLSACNVGCENVKQSDLPSLLNLIDSVDVQPSNEEQMIVSVIGGVAGSHKQNLTNTLIHYNTEKFRWIVIRQTEDDISKFDPQKLHKQLDASLAAHRRRKSGSRRHTNIIVVVQNLCNVRECVEAIESHPDPEISNHIKIGAVTVCVDPLNFFLEKRLVYPGLLTDCMEGWVNNIILTSCTAAKSPLLEEIQGMLRIVNSNVALILAERGEVYRSTDIDSILSDSEFYLPSVVRSRYLSPVTRVKPAVNLNDGQQPTITRLVLHFTQSLDKPKLVHKLKGISSELCGDPWLGNIYHIQGQVNLTGLNESFEVEFITLSVYMKFVPTEKTTQDNQSPPAPESTAKSYLVFTGCGLEESVLKNWLRQCQPPKPEKKQLLTRDKLSNDVINKIHKANHLSVLPEGWFYNGSQYISLDGEKSYTHPQLDKFLEEYIKEKNTEITNINKEIDSIPYIDLFA